MAPKRRLGLVLFALAGAVSLHAVSQAATSPPPAPGQPVFSLAPEEVLGNPQAKVTVIEYASAACPHCARVNNEVIPAFKKKYVDTGKVRYVFRELLTDPVPFAGTAFMMARCAGESKYFDVLNDVFQQQTAIYQSGDLSGGLLKIGAKYGMDKDKLNACMDEKAVDALNARVEKANKDGVDSTPTFIIAGNKSVGEKSLDDLSAAIDPLLAK